jgi:AbrB family looped-hinge helix DNA binding protein
MKSKVTARGQVSIPSEIRKRFNIELDSRVEWIVEGNIIRIIPLPKDALAVLRGRGSGKYSTDRLIEDRRAERAMEDGDERAI